MGEFQDYITEFDDSNTTYTKDALVNAFLNLAQNRHDKHFQQWNDIYYFVLGADSLPATHIARWLLGKNEIVIDPELQYFSSKHNTTINLKDLISFLTKDKNCEDYLELEWFVENSKAIN